MTTVCALWSQIICQKSCAVSSSGCWVTMNSRNLWKPTKTRNTQILYFTFNPNPYGSGAYGCYSNYIMGTRPFHGVQWLGHGTDQQPQFNVLWCSCDTFLIIKPTRCTNFSNLFLEWNSTCFGQFLCPSSGVFLCKHSNGICHTGYADSLWAGAFAPAHKLSA